jgi:hypothetical protein
LVLGAALLPAGFAILNWATGPLWNGHRHPQESTASSQEDTQQP